MAEQLEAKHFLVKGRVQGVGFRRYVEREALTLGLSGWVRNLADGRVEVFARGSVGVMKEFIKRLHEGPPLSQVEEVVEVGARDSTMGAVDSPQDKEAHEKDRSHSARFIIR